jgi:hypothetical protein
MGTKSCIYTRYTGGYNTNTQAYSNRAPVSDSEPLDNTRKTKKYNIKQIKSIQVK